MPNPIPENWEFIKWSNYDEAYVYIENPRYVLSLIQPRQNPFYAAILAAHGPVHEPTDAQLAREAEIKKEQIKSRNLNHIRQELGIISASLDNPSHWNRLNPELKADGLSYYRKILVLREHQVMDGSSSIYHHIPPKPNYDILEPS